MDMDNPSNLFDAYYFAHDCGRPYQRDELWLKQFRAFADRIISDIKPASVLDAGCAWGFLVEALRQSGVEAWGIDISEYAIQNVHPDIRPYCSVGSVTAPLSRRYDLIVCIEVLEHLPQLDAEKAIANFCQHGDDILFSSTPLDYKEATHFNVQPPEYWAECFARHGFYRDVDFDASFITRWAVRFRHKDGPLHRIVRDYERYFMPLWSQNADLRQASIQVQNQLAYFEKRVSELEQEVQFFRSEVEKAACLVADKNNELADKNREIAMLRGELTQLNDRLVAIMNSRRYKLAQKLPKIPQWLRGLK